MEFKGTLLSPFFFLRAIEARDSSKSYRSEYSAWRRTPGLLFGSADSEIFFAQQRWISLTSRRLRVIPSPMAFVLVLLRMHLSFLPLFNA